MTYLHIYQQEEYQPIRFLRWLWNSHSFDRKVSIVILIAGFLELFIHLAYAIAAACVVVACLVVAAMEKDPRKASKKRLSMTKRATRVYWLAFAILAAIAILYTLPGVPVIAWLVLLHVIPLSLAISNLLLTPYEKSVQRGFWEEAHGKLKSLRPTIVGITGSYGKTSTKHLLGHILEIEAATLLSPGSVNTPMGIARVVREQLGPHHRFFVCEMGAYGPGSIARLCRLVPPGFGVITAIGMAHYERFKTLETVAETKFELAQAVAKVDGTVIVHEQAMGFPAADILRNVIPPICRSRARVPRRRSVSSAPRNHRTVLPPKCNGMAKSTGCERRYSESITLGIWFSRSPLPARWACPHAMLCSPSHPRRKLIIAWRSRKALRSRF